MEFSLFLLDLSDFALFLLSSKPVRSFSVFARYPPHSPCLPTLLLSSSAPLDSRLPDHLSQCRPPREPSPRPPPWNASSWLHTLVSQNDPKMPFLCLPCFFFLFYVHVCLRLRPPQGLLVKSWSVSLLVRRFPFRTLATGLQPRPGPFFVSPLSSANCLFFVVRQNTFLSGALKAFFL